MIIAALKNLATLLRAVAADLEYIKSQIQRIADMIDRAAELNDQKMNGFLVCAQDTVEGSVLSTAMLAKIEMFLAAHFLALQDPAILREGTDSISVTYEGGKLGAGLSQTRWGDQAVFLDTTGTLKSLHKALGDLYTVEDEYKLSKLPKYQFMMGMPYVDETINVGEGADLVSKLKDNKYVAYTLQLPNGATLVGHSLRSRTNKFLLKIDAAHNAHILPYRSMIKDGNAVMLDPKYYLAVSLPLLSMGEFMKIASTPAEIEKDIKRTYK